MSTSDTGRARPAVVPNVTLACVVDSCRHAKGMKLESGLAANARRVVAASGDGRVSAKLAGKPLGISVTPLDESALRR